MDLEYKMDWKIRQRSIFKSSRSILRLAETLLALVFHSTNIFGAAPEWQGTDASIGMCADGVATR